MSRMQALRAEYRAERQAAAADTAALREELGLRPPEGELAPPTYEPPVILNGASVIWPATPEHWQQQTIETIKLDQALDNPPTEPPTELEVTAAYPEVSDVVVHTLYLEAWRCFSQAFRTYEKKRQTSIADAAWELETLAGDGMLVADQSDEWYADKRHKSSDAKRELNDLWETNARYKRGRLDFA